MKADNKVVFDEEHPESFTEFEYLKARVDQLEKISNSHADILRGNGLVLSRKFVASYFDDDEVFKALSGE